LIKLVTRWAEKIPTKGIPIVDQRWLQDSFKAEQLLNWSDFEVKKYPGAAVHRNAISMNLFLDIKIFDYYYYFFR
jgi:hypothetical protein